MSRKEDEGPPQVALLLMCKVAKSIAQINPATREYETPFRWNATPDDVAELMAALPATLEKLVVRSKLW